LDLKRRVVLEKIFVYNYKEKILKRIE
jgi:hypothetical protein